MVLSPSQQGGGVLGQAELGDLEAHTAQAASPAVQSCVHGPAIHLTRRGEEGTINCKLAGVTMVVGGLSHPIAAHDPTTH